MTLAAFFVGLAVIVLVSANWEDIPRAFRMGGLTAVTAAANAMGIRAFMQKRESIGIRWREHSRLKNNLTSAVDNRRP
jgi:uncharacterized membrane protein